MVQVRMLAATINPSDAVTVSSAYASRTKFPLVPGFEGLGRVEAIGAGVPESLLGRRILPLGTAENWQQVKQLEAEWCVPVPDDIPTEVACFSYVNPLTALLMVDRYCTPTSRTVVVSAANSSIGGHLAELLNERGVRPIGLVRSFGGRAVAEPSQWQAVLETRDPLWTTQLEELVGARGVDLGFDCVGGEVGALMAAALGRGAGAGAPEGVLVHFGLLSGAPIPDWCFAAERPGRIEMFRLRDTIHSVPRSTLPELLAPVFEHQRHGRLLTKVTRRVGLSELVEFLGSCSSALPTGKVLIDPQG